MHPRTRIFRIEPLPDFVADHTLAETACAARVDEWLGRWVGLVRGLWAWRDRATFALRFLSDGRCTRAYFICAARDTRDSDAVAADARVLLRTHRVIRHPDTEPIDAASCAPELTLARPAFVETAQFALRGLWRTSDLAPLMGELRSRLAFLDPRELEAPLCIYPWRGPSGSFATCFESLISQPVPCALSVYLAPTELRERESQWLNTMAFASQSASESSVTALGLGSSHRHADPSAELAARLYATNLRRLSTTPFLVLVQWTAAENRADVAARLASLAQAVCQEPPARGLAEDTRDLPSGVASFFRVEREMLNARLMQDVDLPALVGAQPLERLQLLVDAAGASTFFRLPLSIGGGVPGLAVRQLPPDFHPGPRIESVPERHVALGTFANGGLATVAVDDLARHALVTGFTGSGKTVTVLNLIHRLWVDHGVPFLVLESAKQEYRGLLAVDELRRRSPHCQVFTLGNETCVPFRLNPFELLPSVRVEAHLSRLQVCFEAAIPPWGPSASVINEALNDAYAECGWLLTDIYPESGTSARRFPTLRDFVEQVERVIQRRGYSGETLDNVRAALVGRLRPLLLGGKGAMFDVQRTSPLPRELFERPTVLEMNDLNLEEKALGVMFVLTLLREWRELHAGASGRLVHLTVVEEAHNVLEDVASVGGGEGATSADTRFKAKEALCSMLAEVRSLGEGLVIADQSPQKLARDAIRNTNLQIAHQLRDGDDRDAIARAMIMDERQRDYLGKLPRGHAALFLTGIEKATFIVVDAYTDGPRARGHGFARRMSDSELAAVARERGWNLNAAHRLAGPYRGCTLCEHHCEFRDSLFPSFAHDTERERAREWIELTLPSRRKELGMSLEQLWDRAARDARDALREIHLADSDDALWCYFVHRWQFGTRDANWSAKDTELTQEHKTRLLQAATRDAGA